MLDFVLCQQGRSAVVVLYLFYPGYGGKNAFSEREFFELLVSCLQILQFDMWGVTPSDLWDWATLKADIAK